ncbi:MAG TPA: hypothetical protein VHV78_05035 [Gemmatimonadaceae bacterium]|jgi:hypothetical protein|nr:hypothetical protein [Gemmatimonadaceae bacterium]
MRATRDGNGNLIVTNTEVLLRVLLVGFVLVLAIAWLNHPPIKNGLGGTAICGIFILALLAGDERSTFELDRSRQLVRWRKTTVFRRSAGEIPFASITGLSLERDLSRNTTRGSPRRLVIHTTSGVVPVTTAYTGIGRQSETVGRAVQSYLNEGAAGKSVGFSTD